MMTRTVTTPPSCSTRTKTQRQQQHQQQDLASPIFTEPPPSTPSSAIPPPHQHTHANTHTHTHPFIYTHDQPPSKRAKLHHSPPQVSGQLPLRARDAHSLSNVVPRPDSLPKRQIQTQLVNIRGPRDGDDGSGEGKGGRLSFARPGAMPDTNNKATESALARPTRSSLRHPQSIQTDEGDMALVKEVKEGGEDANMHGNIVTKNEVHLKPTPGPSTSAPAGSEKRSLRSHDGGTRPSKSELAMYFPNYEQILSLEPVKQEFLCAETTVTLVDDLREPIVLNRDDVPSSSKAPCNPLENLHKAEVVDLGLFAETSDKDPLDEDAFFKAHRRLERQEKQLRNLEKERAQYEKVQLDHLLGELQGHDWLRVMGINGVTDTEKKLYEPKRDYFVGEVTALLEKFRAWKEEEKRRRVEREQALQAEEDEEEESDSQEEDEAEDEEGEGESDVVDESSEHTSPTAVGSVPDPDDVDGLAAHQLYQEAISASKSKKLKTRNDKPTSQPRQQPKPQSQPKTHTQQQAPSSNPPETTVAAPYIEPDLWVVGPFISFYSKPHLREAAIKKHKRGRTRTAFGKPLPEFDDAPFRLPEDILTPEAIRASQRRNRRMRREDGRPGKR
ncbi:uncharacterized protein GIQ15_04723 [Arthroderma uncinatum]|uniref:uncharacterized protein n=1 Tax=Arthroderma uncinatum TaxID=74035 RepID=UPI00144AB9CD|nr:uncharacterized protein GIQ15_04723 [Arthroderma uncinatum]KAF3481964.1 hypothetical protein GIQ15_04723 [Arthroderma uncinatum]